VAYHLLALRNMVRLALHAPAEINELQTSMNTLRNRLLTCFTWLLLFAAPCVNRAADSFIAFNDFWFYLDNGTDPGTAWRFPGFDHYSNWSLGITEMGFGDGDEFTELNPAPGGVPLNTAYFATYFNVNNAGNYSNLTVRVLRDDGAVVYINGVEVFRSNMPTGTVNYATKALRNIEADEEFLMAQRVVPASVLISGENTLAVEVHQAEGGNNDMSFALVLTGHRVGENQPPSANSSFVTVEQDKSTNITLMATDPDSNPLSYTLVSFPEHGSLSGTAPNVTYTPNSGYVGPDLFSFMASDSQWNTEVAYVCIDVKVPSNHPPVPDAQDVTVAEDNPLTITLTANDPDGDALSYSYTSAGHGTLTAGPGHTVLYQPALNYFGPDDFTFTVDDGHGGTATAAINITVTPVNDAPVADSQTLMTDEDSALAVVLTASDVEGDALSFSFAQPAHSVVTGAGNYLTYQPAANYSGPDSFTFTVDDGHGGITTATVNITVTPVNDAPVAFARGASASDPAHFTRSLVLIATNNQSALVILNGSDSSDVDGDSLSYAWHQGASTTPLSIDANPTVSLPAGSYALTLVVSDGTAMASDTITVQIVTLCDAVQTIVSEVQAANLKPSQCNGLLSHLNGACSAFDDGNLNGGVHQLELFQARVNNKIAPTNPSLAQTLNAEAQRIIDEVSGQ
jgi:hypothetical protein